MRMPDAYFKGSSAPATTVAPVPSFTARLNVVTPGDAPSYSKYTAIVAVPEGKLVDLRGGTFGDAFGFQASYAAVVDV
jgi:hypothetical protein